MRRRRSWAALRRAGLLIALCAAGGVLAAMVSSPENETPIVEPENNNLSRDAADKPLLAPRAPFEASRASLERPLFHASRRPLPDRAAPAAPAPIEPPPPPPPPPPTGYRLRGAILGSGRKLAVLENMGTAQHTRIGEGEKIDGWTLTDIEAKRVTFAWRDQAFVLELAPPDEKP